MPARRKKYKRVVRKGTELFDADGVKKDPADGVTEAMKEALGKFNSTNDVTALQTELAGAAAMK